MNYRDFFNTLCCPIHGNKLEYNDEHDILVNKPKGIYYKIVDNVPVLTSDHCYKLGDMNQSSDKSDDTNSDDNNI